MNGQNRETREKATTDNGVRQAMGGDLFRKDEQHLILLRPLLGEHRNGRFVERLFALALVRRMGLSDPGEPASQLGSDRRVLSTTLQEIGLASAHPDIRLFLLSGITRGDGLTPMDHVLLHTGFEVLHLFLEGCLTVCRRRRYFL